MKEIQVKEIMIPMSDYLKVKKDQSLMGVIIAMGASRESENKRPYRDAIVVDGKDQFIGKVTMVEILKALEPKYKQLDPKQTSKIRELFGDQTTERIMNFSEEFNLWSEPMSTLRERGKKIMVTQIIHIPEQQEYVNETDTLERALHKFVSDAHQPLVVKKGDQITGFLRISDLIEIVRTKLLED
jgi:CBS domain containing-hemolysin-like protein